MYIIISQPIYCYTMYGLELTLHEGPQNRLTHTRVHKTCCFPRSQSISISLYTECQKRRKVPQINQTCVKRITFYLAWLREAL